MSCLLNTTLLMSHSAFTHPFRFRQMVIKEVVNGSSYDGILCMLSNTIRSCSFITLASAVMGCFCFIYFNNERKFFAKINKILH